MRKPPPLADDMALFLDFDGTLVEFADRPELVAVPALLIDRLTAAATRLKGALAVVSGRRITDIDSFLGGAVKSVAGLHGWERRSPPGDIFYATPMPESVDAARAYLEDFAAKTEGVVFEDKGAALALHYRLRPPVAEACWNAVLTAERACPDLEARGGQYVVELRPRRIDKGQAVAAFLAVSPFAGRRPVFIGDDATDEDAFAIVTRAQGLGVLVGPQRTTHATASLDSVAAVHEWLGR